LSYRETRPRDSDLFSGVLFDFIVEFGLDIAIELLACLFEAL
jgi:hypothetical protein